MTTLYLLRHAHAGDPEKFTGDDAARPLSEKGRRQSERLGRVLSGSGDAPDLFVTSPKVRADDTARIVAKAVGAKVVVDPRLGGALDADVVAEIVAAAGPAERPCLVGHDPDFSDVLGEFIGVSVVPMRKAALARIDFPGPVRAGRGVIRVLLPPELVPGS